MEFMVYGTPQPQGSMKPVKSKGGEVISVTSSNKKLKPWRQQVSETADSLMGGAPLMSGPVMVRIAFYFQKPKSTKASVVFKSTRPDVDKLARAILDALTGVVFNDDAQVFSLQAEKHFGHPERTIIGVYPK